METYDTTRATPYDWSSARTQEITTVNYSPPASYHIIELHVP